MLLFGKLLYLLFLFRKQRCHILGTFYMICFSIRCNECIMVVVAQSFAEFSFSKCFLAIIDFPHTMIKLYAIVATVTELGCIASAVLWVVHKSVAVHLKPVDVLLIRQTADSCFGRQNGYMLFHLVETQLNIVVNYPIIAYSPFIHICITFIIRNVVPLR